MQLNFSALLNPRIKWILLIVIGVILVIIGIALYASKHGVMKTTDYGIVIDISSTHTKITPFHWSDAKVNNTAMIEMESSCIVHSGINEYTTNSNQLYADIYPCLNQVFDVIPTDLEMKIHIYPLATDGYDLLKLANPSLATNVLEQLNQNLLNFKPGDPKINLNFPRGISGREVGMYTWVAANYLSHVIPSQNNSIFKTSSGILRLGDSASQIAFVEDQHFANDAVELFGQKYSLRVDSNPCFGGNEVVKRYFTLILKTLSTLSVLDVPDPCANPGMVRYINGSDLIKNVCVQTVDEPITKFIKSDFTYKFIGKNNEAVCAQTIQELLDKEKCDKNFEYCFNTDNTEWRSDMQFYATDKYYNVTRVLPTLFDHEVVTRELFDLQVTSFCALKWSEVITANPGISPNTCMMLRYINQSLHTAYNVQTREWSQIKFVDKINGNEVIWPIGFMLNESKEFPNMASPTSYIGIWGFLILLVIGSCLVAYGAMKIFGDVGSATGAKQPSGEYEIL